MKYTLTLFMVFLFPRLSFSQPWLPVGPDDFKQISGINSYFVRAYADTNGNAYVSFVDSINGNGSFSFRRTVIKKETPNGWIPLAVVEDSNYNSSLAIDKGGNFYFANDTVILGSAYIIVRKFDGIAWTNIGAPYLVGNSPSPWLDMVIDRFDQPWIVFSDTGSSVFPKLIKWNGTSWNQIGSAIINSSFQRLNIAFNSANEPHVQCYDILNNQSQIRKFDGTNWIVAQNNTPSGTLHIHKDSFYLSGGMSGHWGGTSFISPRTTVWKYNGLNWQIIANLGLIGGTPAVPLVPSEPSPKLVFDSTGALYLAGGIIWKIQGTTITAFGAEGDLVFVAPNKFFAAIADLNYAKKVRFKRWVNNLWYEDYPVSVSGFRTGYLSTYHTYNNQPFHEFFNDTTGRQHLFSWYGENGGSLAKYESGMWTSLAATASVSGINPLDAYRIMPDTNNNFFLMFKNLTSSNSGKSLYKYSGTQWVPYGPSVNNTIVQSSFIIDKNNAPIVAFIDNSSFAASRVRAKKYNGSAWADVSVSIPLISTSAAQNPLIVCDTANHVSILYKQANDLYVMKFDGINWNQVGGSVGATAKTDYDVALTESGDIVVAYLTGTGAIQKPTVKKFDGTNWVTLGISGFSYGIAKELDLLINRDTIFLAYTDSALQKVVVARFDGSNFGAAGSLSISKYNSSNPKLIKADSTIYVSYASAGIFVKKLATNSIAPLFACPTIQPSINALNDTSVTIIWSAPALSSAGYEYGLGAAPVLPPLNTTTSATLSYTTSGLIPGTTYHFAIRNVCGIDTSLWTTLSFTTTNTLVSSTNRLASIVAFPNPADHTLNITGLEINDRLELTDVTGRKIRTIIELVLPKARLDVRNLAPGFYHLIITRGTEKQAFPILKQ